MPRIEREWLKTRHFLYRGEVAESAARMQEGRVMWKTAFEDVLMKDAWLSQGLCEPLQANERKENGR